MARDLATIDADLAKIESAVEPSDNNAKILKRLYIDPSAVPVELPEDFVVLPLNSSGVIGEWLYPSTTDVTYTDDVLLFLDKCSTCGMISGRHPTVTSLSAGNSYLFAVSVYSNNCSNDYDRLLLLSSAADTENSSNIELLIGSGSLKLIYSAMVDDYLDSATVTKSFTILGNAWNTVGFYHNGSTGEWGLFCNGDIETFSLTSIPLPESTAYVDLSLYAQYYDFQTSSYVDRTLSEFVGCIRASSDFTSGEIALASDHKSDGGPYVLTGGALPVVQEVKGSLRVASNIYLGDSLSPLEGIPGPQGPQGPTGPQGTQGPSGDDGIDGVDGPYVLPPGWLYGLGLANAADADHDITISAGCCRDYSKSYNMDLTAPITKQIDATWAAGDGAGGLFSGTVASNATYHTFLIRKDSDGSIDAGFDTSVSAANIPTGYTAYRRIGSFKTDASANILGFTQKADTFWYGSMVQDVSTTTPGTARHAVTLTVPTGLNGMDAIVSFTVRNDATGNYVIDPTWVPDYAPTDTYFHLRTTNGAGNAGSTFTVGVDASGQITYRSSDGSGLAGLYINTIGWIDDRGKLGGL